jgi:hypothetical protein
MQSTGESIITSSLNTLRQSVLGGRSLNRFSHFVTTGAEDWILNGYQTEDQASRGHERFKSDATLDGSDLGASTITEADRHFVEVRPPFWLLCVSNVKTDRPGMETKIAPVSCACPFSVQVFLGHGRIHALLCDLDLPNRA